MNLVLRYRRSMRDGGRVTGDIIVTSDDNGVVVQQLDRFDSVDMRDMLVRYGNLAKQNPSHKCLYQRIDKPGFKVLEWAPAHIDQMRQDPEKTADELSEVRTVTYDMRKPQSEKETE